MKIQVVTPPTELPLTLQDIKTHLRIEDSESEYNNDLTNLIEVAAEWVLANCHLTLLYTVYRCYFDKFETPLKLPVYPVGGIQPINYVDVDGNSQTISSYQLDFLDCPAKVYPAIDAEWPELQEGKINPISIDVNAGIAEEVSGVPALAKHLIRLLVAHWFVHREAVGTGTTKEIEFSANELVKMLRVNEFEAF